jgi:hypothetical protein
MCRQEITKIMIRVVDKLTQQSVADSGSCSSRFDRSMRGIKPLPHVRSQWLFSSLCILRLLRASHFAIRRHGFSFYW